MGVQVLLDTRLAKCGLAVIAFPSNDFGNQEPKSNAEIKEFVKKASTPPPLRVVHLGQSTWHAISGRGILVNKDSAVLSPSFVRACALPPAAQPTTKPLAASSNRKL